MLRETATVPLYAGWEENMDFYRIECFLAAAETGSMTKAAEKMYVTQPAISFQIRELERKMRSTAYEVLGSGLRAWRICANSPDP